MKIGKLSVSKEFYEKDYKLFYTYVLSVFRIVEITYKWNGILVMIGISDLFEEIKEGDASPEYDGVFTTLEDGTHEFKFVRK